MVEVWPRAANAELALGGPREVAGGSLRGLPQLTQISFFWPSSCAIDFAKAVPLAERPSNFLIRAYSRSFAVKGSFFLEFSLLYGSGSSGLGIHICL